MRRSLISLNNKSQVFLNSIGLAAFYYADMSIGGRFRQLRQHLDLSGEQMGELMGVTKGMVSQWESDSTTPPADRLIALAQQHPFSLDWLLRGVGQMLPVGMYISDRRIMAAVKAMEPLPEYGKDQVIKSVIEVAELIAQAQLPKPNGTNG